MENYIKPGNDYNHLDLDLIFSSSKIIDHPYGRQKMHLTLGLIESFNDLMHHPSDGYVIDKNNLTAEGYRQLVKTHFNTQTKKVNT